MNYLKITDIESYNIDFNFANKVWARSIQRIKNRPGKTSKSHKQPNQIHEPTTEGITFNNLTIQQIINEDNN
jgi:hypothetical protein